MTDKDDYIRKHFTCGNMLAEFGTLSRELVEEKLVVLVEIGNRYR